MSEIPWYGWFNLIGLMALWMFYGFGHMLEKSSKLVRTSHHLVILIAAFFVSGWYQLLLTNGANWLVVAAGVLLLAATAWELFGGTYMLVADAAKPAKLPEKIKHAPALVEAVAADGALDLDAGTRLSPENQEKMQRAIKGVFASGSSGTERLDGIGTLLNQGDEEEDTETLAEKASYGMIGIAIVAVILLPPCLIAWKVILSVI